MPAQIVYLDQNKWIALAQAHYHRQGSVGLTSVLNSLRGSVASRNAIVPLSATHYMETWRHADPERRRRLGDFMADISAGFTICPWREILVHEVSTALSRRFPQIAQTNLQLLGSGVVHAFGMDRLLYQLPEGFRGRLSPDQEAEIERKVRQALERTAISGSGVRSVPAAPAFGLTTHNEVFRDHLDGLHATLQQLPPSKREDALYAMSFVDILPLVKEVLAANNIPWEDLALLGVEDIKRIVDELPSRSADLHLHRQIARNPALRARLTDLEDFSGLGPAAAYCDVVVCEKHFASMLGRRGFQSKARVLTDLNSLPDALSRPAAT